MSEQVKLPGEWEGVNDDTRWKVEVEADCMAESEPFTVSVWVGWADSGEPWPSDSTQGAFLSPEQAREVAARLLIEADSADDGNRRVAAYKASRDREGGEG